MAEEEKTKEQKEELERTIDLDAFAPEREKDARYIKFKGKKYEIAEFIDLELDEVAQVLHFEEKLRGKPLPEQLVLIRKSVKILVPAMPDEVVNQLSTRQIIRLVTRSFGVSEKESPQLGSESESDSGT